MRNYKALPIQGHVHFLFLSIEGTFNKQTKQNVLKRHFIRHQQKCLIIRLWSTTIISYSYKISMSKYVQSIILVREESTHRNYKGFLCIICQRLSLPIGKKTVKTNWNEHIRSQYQIHKMWKWTDQKTAHFNIYNKVQHL